jgi:hypothetical protein
MLAALQQSVSDAGGTYVFCDTDSMAIVASEHGGHVACVGGPEQLPDGRTALRSLSWAQVACIVDRFGALNPYDRDAVPGSVLKVEDVNFDNGGKGPQRQLWAYAISAKRYELDARDADGMPVIVDAKAHGLGHVLAPDDPPRIAPQGRDEGESDARDTDSSDAGGKLKPWMRREWEAIAREALGLPVPERPYLDRMAVGRITVSSPAVWRAFRAYNRRKPYSQQMKPFSFLLTAHVDPFGIPPGVDPAHFRLVAPFETDPRKWQRLPWRNLYDTRADAPTYRPVIGAPESVSPTTVVVQTYRDIVDAYRVHPEAKSAGADGLPCGRTTVGLLAHRSVLAVGLRVIGKESNRLQDVEEGLIGSPDDVYTSYVDTAAKLAMLRRVLDALPDGTVAHSAGISTRRLREIKAGRETPHPDTRTALERAAQHVMVDGLVILGRPLCDVAPLAPLVLEALTTAFTECVHAARGEVSADLQTLASALGERCTAVLCGVSQKTVNNWRMEGMPVDPATIGRVREKLAPYRQHVARLDALQAALGERTTERDALAATFGDDPHARYVQWTERTDRRYSRATWRTEDRLVAVRRPPAGRRDWLRETVDYRDILDREAQQLGEDWETFWQAVKRAAVQRNAVAGLDAERAGLHREWERHCAALRKAAQ